MYRDLALYIDGEFIGCDGVRAEREVINPASGAVIGKLPLASTEDLDHALDASNRAFSSWRAVSPIERGDILRRVAGLARERAHQIGLNITQDQGKPLTEAVAEVLACAGNAEWHAEECRRIYGRVIPPRQAGVRQIVLREPVGVCAAFSPWNFPCNQAIRKIVAAVGSGCTIILKGPEESPSAVVALAEIFHDAGLPPGVLNIVWGVPAEVSRHLIESPVVRKVSFTGSVVVGKQLASLAGAHMKRMTMELGGHAPVLVFDDADIEAAAAVLGRFKLRNAGQICISPSRFFVQERAYERFLSAFTDSIASVSVGEGLTEGVEMGPLANGRRVAFMEELVDDISRRGGQIVCGAKRIGTRGFFYEPTVVTEIADDARVMQEEPFGPIAPVVRFRTTEEVLQRANSLPYGLAAYAFTGSLKTATEVSNGLTAGMVSINHLNISLPETPFGGVNDSGLGSEGGSETFDGYLATKYVTQV